MYSIITIFTYYGNFVLGKVVRINPYIKLHLELAMVHLVLIIKLIKLTLRERAYVG